MSYSIQGKRVWVAGHRGMVGQALLRRLAREDCQVLTAGRETLDLRSPDAVNVRAYYLQLAVPPQHASIATTPWNSLQKPRQAAAQKSALQNGQLRPAHANYAIAALAEIYATVTFRPARSSPWGAA